MQVSPDPEVSVAARSQPAGSIAGEEFREDHRPAARAASRVRHLLSQDELRPFTTLVAWRSWLAILQTFGALVVLVTLAVLAWRAGGWSALWLVPCVFLIATQQHALFVLAHEAAHYRLFASRALNDCIGRLAGTIGGISMCTYRVTHRLHHNHLYGRQDPDIALNGGYPRGAWYLARKLLIDLSGWTAPKTYAYFFGAPAINSETLQAQRPLTDTSEALRAAARRDRWVVVGVHVLMPIAVTALSGWSGLLLYLLVWILPLVTVMQAILRLRAVAEHGAPAGLDSPLLAARTNLAGAGVAGWLVRLVFFPHHVNHHIEHHLYPAVPHYHLPALHALLRDRGLLDAAEVRPFMQTLRRVFQGQGIAPAPGPERAL